jgi:hypothetical protein
MNRDSYKTLTWLMWLALPTTGLNYWLAWDRLPYRMAVHFDANWQPNGYTSREGALKLGLGIMGFILIVSTIVALVARAMKPQSSWPVLVVSYIVLGLVTYGNYSILKFNLNSQPAHSELVGFPPGTSDSEKPKVLPLHS